MMPARHSAAALGAPAFFRFLSGKTERKGTPHQQKVRKRAWGLLPTPGPVTKRMGGNAWQKLPIRRLTAGPTAKGYRGVSQGVSPWACFGYFPTRESNAPPARRNGAKPLGLKPGMRRTALPQIRTQKPNVLHNQKPLTASWQCSRSGLRPVLKGTACQALG